MIERFDHLVLTVAIVPTTLDFYKRILGLTVKREEGLPAALLLGGQKINVHQVDHTFDRRHSIPSRVQPISA